MKDRDFVLGRLGVSRETADLFDRYVSLLQRWQAVKNLVGPRTLEDVWERHIADSAQLVPLIGDRRHVVDLGSGAGFPGLVLAILLRDRSDAKIHLIESNSRKSAFLREVSRALSLPVVVHNARIEDALTGVRSVQVITARALAPLGDLLSLTNELLKGDTIGVFPKGQDAERELTEAAQWWRFDATTVVSRTDPKARIVTIQNARPVSIDAESGGHD